jgi:uncharacterized membrane protein YozB (DUF420 family)
MAAPRAANPERRFYQLMILALIACVVLGFSRSFFLRPLFPGVHAPAETFFYLHGAVFTGWLALLCTQVSLIGVRNVALHRRLGVAGFVMVPLMVVLGTIGGLIAARRPGGFIDIPVPPLEFLIVPLSGMVLFAGLAGSGLLLRRNPQAHKRLMLLGTIAIAEAGIARWPFEPYVSIPPIAFWTTAAFILPMIGWDLYSQHRIHPATLIGGTLLVISGPLRELASHTAPWLAFAKWATGLLG